MGPKQVDGQQQEKQKGNESRHFQLVIHSSINF